MAADEHEAAMGELDKILSNMSPEDATAPSAADELAAVVVRRVAEKEGVDESRICEVLDTLKKEEIIKSSDLRLLPRSAWASLGVPLGLVFKIQEQVGGRDVETPPAMSPLSVPSTGNYLLNSLGERPKSSTTVSPSALLTTDEFPSKVASVSPASSPSTRSEPSMSTRVVPKGGGWAGAKPSHALGANAPMSAPRQFTPGASLSDQQAVSPSSTSILASTDQSRRISPVPSPRGNGTLSNAPSASSLSSSLSAARQLSPRPTVAKPTSLAPPPSLSPPSISPSPSLSTFVVTDSPTASLRAVVDMLLAFAELRSSPPPQQLSPASARTLFDRHLIALHAYAMLTDVALTTRQWTVSRLGGYSEGRAGEWLRVHIASTQTTFHVVLQPEPPYLYYAQAPPAFFFQVPGSPLSTSLPSASPLLALALPLAERFNTSASLSPVSPHTATHAPPLSPRSNTGTGMGTLLSPRSAGGGDGAHVLYKRRLIQHKDWTDVVLNFAGLKVASHSYVLLVRGEGLLSLKDRLALEKRKKKSHVLDPYHVDFHAKDVVGLSVATIELLLDFIYTGESTNLTRLPAKDLVTLASAARRFKFERLLWLSERALRLALSSDNVHAAMKHAADMREPELVRVCMLYALLHYQAFIGHKVGVTHVGIDLYSEVVRLNAQMPEMEVEAQFGMDAMRVAPAHDYSGNWLAILEDMASADGVARFVWGTDSHQRPLLLGDKVRFHKAVLASLSDALASYIKEAPTEEVMFFVTPDSFRALLRYAYVADNAFTVQHVADLFPFAQRTHTTDLFKLLDDRIRDPASLNTHNVLYILSVTYMPHMRDRADVQRTRASALAFFFEHIGEVDLLPLRHMPPITAVELILAAQIDASKS